MVGLHSASSVPSAARQTPMPAGGLCARPGFLSVLKAVAIVLAWSGQAHAAGTIKLTDGVELGGPVVRQVEISPDGTRVVFAADTEAGDIAAVFSVPIGGGLVTQLAGGTIVMDNYTIGDLNIQGMGKKVFQIAPDGQSVIYSSEPSAGHVDLHSIAITGGSATHLASLDGNTIGSLRFAVTPDSGRVLYNVWPDRTLADPHIALYSVAASGGQAPLALFDFPSPEYATVSGAYVGPSDSMLSPDGTKALASDTNTLYIRCVDGGPTTTLASTDLPYTVEDRHFTADGSRIVYTARNSEVYPSAYYVYSVGADGGTPLLVYTGENSSNSRPKGIKPDKVTETPDGKQLIAAETGALGQTRFVSIDLANGASTELGTVTTGTARYFERYAIRHDAAGAVYLASDDAGARSWWHVSFAGGEALRLSDDLAPAADYPSVMLGLMTCQITPDDLTVVYDFATADGREIYSVPIDGGASIRLDAGPGEASYVLDFDLTPDGQYVIYTVGEASDWFFFNGGTPVTGLYAVNVHGGTPWLLNDPLAEGDCIGGYTIGPDGRAVFWAGNAADGYELYSAAVPEPATLALLATGAMGALYCRRSTTRRRS